METKYQCFGPKTNYCHYFSKWFEDNLSISSTNTKISQYLVIRGFKGISSFFKQYVALRTSDFWSFPVKHSMAKAKRTKRKNLFPVFNSPLSNPLWTFTFLNLDKQTTNYRRIRLISSVNILSWGHFQNTALYINH